MRRRLIGATFRTFSSAAAQAPQGLAPTATSAAGVVAPPAPREVANALRELGVMQSLARKPWLLLERHRRTLEQHWDVETGTVLLALQGWAKVASGGLPTVTGIANVSGNVYFACDVRLKSAESDEPAVHLTAVQALIANLFSHSEIGMDAIVSDSLRPAALDVALVRELYTFPELRWLHTGSALEAARKATAAGSVEEPARPKEVALTTSGRWELKKRKSLARYPRALDFIDEGQRGGPKGDNMRHDDYLHQEVEGTTLEEWQSSLARGSMLKSYDAGGAVPRAGCAVLDSAGKLYGGSTIAARGGLDGGAVTPLECAMVSMAANGTRPTDITRVVWVAADGSDDVALRHRDTELLARVAPGVALLAAL